MARTAKKLYYSIKMARPVASVFPISLYATASPIYRDVFYTVPRAGHLIGGAEHHVTREHFPGHELIFCLHGRGFVRVAGVTQQVEEGDLVWVNCHHPHEHGAIATDPWEVFWVRIEGPRLEQMCQLLGVDGQPVITGVDAEKCVAVYRDVFKLMIGGAPEATPLLHAAIAQLISLVFTARQRYTPQTNVPAPLRKAMEKMRLFYFEPLTVADLAAHAGMSASHFARVFKATFGTGPIDWLRRERISQAKRRLGDSTDPIQQIAEQVGYRDRFFFSKDFKKLTGFTPREFRLRES